MIKILVDSASDYPMEEVNEKGLLRVPLRVMLGGETYVDGVTIQPTQFYQMLMETKEFPKTSQPSPQDFADKFEEAKKNGDDVICILLSSALSGTCQSAMLAKNMVDYDRIYIIDSLSAVVAIKIMADYGLRLIDEGLTAPEIVARIENMKSRVKIAAALDTLEYLRRGGRIGKAAAIVGELANLKPMISVSEEGTIDAIGKCLGKNKAINQLIRHLESSKLDPNFPMLTVYSYDTANCEKFEKKLADNGHKVSGRYEIGTTIGAHVGPGAFGVIYVVAE